MAGSGEKLLMPRETFPLKKGGAQRSRAMVIAKRGGLSVSFVGCVALFNAPLWCCNDENGSIPP